MSDVDWDTLQALFHQAQKIPDDELDEFLNQACGENLELHEEVLKLLKAGHSGSADFTEQISQTSQQILDDNIKGTRIGPYKIIRELGQGGMGSVYLAERADDHFEQQVAIKLISGSLKSDAIAQRFIDERQILASLKHPNIALLLDGGTTESGEPYFAMEYLSGKDIISYCDDLHLNLKQRIKLFIQVCQAVSHAHGHLILHRDIKPANILVSETGQVKLLDFGIAKILKTDELDPQVTAKDQMIMTPEYASPEQVLGDNMSVASDVYQLGLVLYQLLTGQQAVQIKNASVAEVKSKVVDELPLSPSQRLSQTEKQDTQSSKNIANNRSTQPDSLMRKLKGDLDTIVLKCLHKDPTQRYQAVNELNEDLQAYTELRPIKARNLSLSYRLNRYLRRHWLVVSTSALAVLALIGGLAFSLINLERTKQAELRATTEATTAEQISEFLIDMITNADPRESGGEEITVKQILAESIEKIDALDDQPIIQIKLLQTLGHANTGMGSFQMSQKLLERAVNLAETTQPLNNEILISSLGLLSDAHSAQGNNKQALDLTTRAIQIAKQKDLIGVDILVQHHVALAANDQFNAAIPFAEQGLELLRMDNSDKSIKIRINLLAHLALVLQTNGDLVLSEKYIKEGLGLIQNKPAFLNRKLNLLISLGTVYTIQERYLDAEQLMLETLPISAQVFGQEHIENVKVYLLLGRNQLRQFKTEAADATINQAMQVTENTVGKFHPAYIQLLEVLANVKQVEGDYVKSLEVLRHSTLMAKEKMGDQHGITLVSQAHQIPLLLFIGRIPEATILMDQVFNDFSLLMPPDHPFMIWIYSLVADVSIKAGNTIKADKMAKKVMKSSDNSMVLRGISSTIKKSFLVGDLVQAKTLLTEFDNILSGYENRYSKFNHNQSNYLFLFSELLASNKKYQAAQETIEDAIQFLNNQYFENHPKSLILKLRKAEYLSYAGQHNEAIKLAENSYQQWIEQFDENENSSAMMAVTLASIYHRSGQIDKAETLIKSNNKTLQESLGPNHFQSLRANCLMGKIQSAKGLKLEGSFMVKHSVNGLISQLGANSPLVKICQSKINSVQ